MRIDAATVSACAENELQQAQANAVLENQPDDAERRAAERKGVLGAGRLLVDRPEADQRIELVGERHGDGDRVGGHAVGWTDRPVMVLDGRGDRHVLVRGGGVIAPHQALQLGELADHLGDQIGLGKLGGALGERRIGRHQRRDLARQPLQPPDALALCAELLVEDDGVELGQALGKRGLEVGLPEIAGVGQARTNDALIAGDDRLAAVAGLDIGDQDEAVGEPALGAGSALGGGAAVVRAAVEHEAFLVGADGGADDLGRDSEEILVEGADMDHRPFDQSGHLVEQRLVLDQVEAERQRLIARIGEDHLLAPVGVEHDLGALELHGIVVEALHRDRIGRHEAMTVGDVAGFEAVDREGHDLGVRGFRTEDAEDRMQRPDPGEAAGGT